MRRALASALAAAALAAWVAAVLWAGLAPAVPCTTDAECCDQHPETCQEVNP